MSAQNGVIAKKSKTQIIGWIITLGLPLIILCIPTTDVFTYPIKVFFVITLFAVMTFVFGNINQTTIALMFPLLYIIFSVAPSEVVLSPWTGNIPWMMLGGLLMADVLADIGLLKRVAYKCIILTGGSYSGICWGLFVAGFVLNIFIPGKVVVPLAALSYGICRALNLEKSKEAGGIMLVAAVSAIIPAGLIFYNPLYFVMVRAGLDATGPLNISWVQYFINNSVSILFLMLIVFVGIKMFKPKEVINGKEYFIQEYKKLGNLTIQEKKAIAVVLLMFLALLTTNIHKVDAGWCFAFIPLLLFLPGVNVGKPEAFKKANWSFVIFVGSCSTIGSTAGYLGLGKIMADLIMPLITGLNPVVILMIIWAICILLNFALMPLAVMSAFALPIAQIAVNIGINPLAAYFILWHGTEQLIMPYEVPLYLIFFSFGLIRLKDFVKFCSIKMVLNGVFIVAVLIPFWKLIGFLMI